MPSMTANTWNTSHSIAVALKYKIRKVHKKRKSKWISSREGQEIFQDWFDVSLFSRVLSHMCNNSCFIEGIAQSQRSRPPLRADFFLSNHNFVSLYTPARINSYRRWQKLVQKRVNVRLLSAATWCNFTMRFVNRPSPVPALIDERIPARRTVDGTNASPLRKCT
jgi:hypothetical protein